jgi:zinc/manganese transport system permease protein
MWEIMDILWPALAACVILTGIHCYLGLHVVSRGVIFVDLALAQVAALGSTLALLAGYELESPQAYAAALAFTVIGAALFALGRFRDEVVPQEAIIGIVYAVGSAAAILILDRAPHGGEAIRQMLIGSILYVSWGTVLKTALIYSAVGVAHFIFRKQFLLISTDIAEARRRRMPIRFWDFLFYSTFGLVVTSSVQIAGILMVFSYLVVPAVCAMLFFKTIRARLVAGWTTGLLFSVVGLSASAWADLPTGAAVVAAFGAAVILAAVGRVLLAKKFRGGAS